MSHALIAALHAPILAGTLVAALLIIFGGRGSERYATGAALLAVIGVVQTLVDFFTHQWFWCAADIAMTAFWFREWWRHRKRRDPAPRVLGAKSQARVDALAGRMAEEGA